MHGEVSHLELLLTRGRALSIAYLIGEQVPSAFTHAARVSARFIIAYATAGPELRVTAELLGLRDNREVERLRRLAPGEAIVAMSGSRLPAPLLVQFPLPDIDRSNLTRPEREFYTRRALEDQIPNVKPRYTGFLEERQEVKQRERDPNRLSANAWRVFARIAQYPYETIEDRMVALNLNRGEENAGRKEPEHKGFIAEAGTYGRGIVVCELTPKGRAFAEQHNIPVHTYKSGAVHEALLRRTMRALSKASSGLRWVSPSGATGPVQPDAYGLFTDGQALCVQIHYRNKLDYEIKRLIDLCKIDHVDLVLFVAPTKKAVEAASSVIGERWRDEVPRRYVLTSATECLVEGFDWVGLLERSA
jgi:hypothetical protein